jgi:hypothetical protein
MNKEEPSQVVLHRRKNGKLEIAECDELFIGSRDALQSIIDQLNDRLDDLNAERKLADDLANELSCLANWREVHNIDCNYNARPLADWEASRMI